ncbi:hypothetical protein DFJ74DRAFT_329974 [Hyaloraphidium curvatum]|nr:hypothetical protein DFJ74DRAFT_329974 [Hyaloraphidium curvatum]
MDKVLAAGRVAVITGAASGIGRAAALTFVQKYGMKVAIADIEAKELAETAEAIRKLAKSPSDVLDVPTDVSDPGSIAALHAATEKAFGKDVALLFNNAGTGIGGGVLAPRDRFTKVIDINGWGVINGTREYLPGMLEQSTPAMIINTGSKQGITTPPGNLSYNISKAMVKVFTEGLAHELRNSDKNKNITAHLLVPGWVATGISVKTAKAMGTIQSAAEYKGSWEENPAPGAWTPQQTVDYMLERLAAGDFYIICPDNETTLETDKKRITWAAQDITENRPPLSRWHPDWAPRFTEFMKM